MSNDITRCSWVNTADPVYTAYHDNEWGKPCRDDGYLFQLLILEGFQAGLSWKCVLDKRENMRLVFSDFNPEIMAKYDENKIQELMETPGIIRNRAKIRGAVSNAAVFLTIQKEFGSFSNYIWNFTGGSVIEENWKERTTSPLSDLISADLKKRGMKFMGSLTVYAFLQAMGIINAHDKECAFHSNL